MEQPKMTGDEFLRFAVNFRKRFLDPNAPYDFLDTWERAIRRYIIEDVMAGLEMLNKDDRIRQDHPRFYLPLLLEHISDCAVKRQRAQDMERRRKEEEAVREQRKTQPQKTYLEMMAERGNGNGR